MAAPDFKKHSLLDETTDPGAKAAKSASGHKRASLDPTPEPASAAGADAGGGGFATISSNDRGKAIAAVCVFLVSCLFLGWYYGLFESHRRPAATSGGALTTSGGDMTGLKPEERRQIQQENEERQKELEEDIKAGVAVPASAG